MEQLAGQFLRSVDEEGLRARDRVLLRTPRLQRPAGGYNQDKRQGPEGGGGKTKRRTGGG